MPAKAKGTMSTTRLRKVHCEACGVICRMSRGAILKSGLPWCGCGERMTCADLEDLAVVDPDAPALVEAAHDIERYAERSEQQMSRWSARGKAQPELRERREVALARGAEAIIRRHREAATPVFGTGGDDIPF